MLPSITGISGVSSQEFANERDILYKLFFDLRKDVTELKKMFFEVLNTPGISTGVNYPVSESAMLQDYPVKTLESAAVPMNSKPILLADAQNIDHHEEVEESLAIADKEKELILKALKKHRGKRKDAALDLGISERTLYRKLKEYNIDA